MKMPQVGQMHQFSKLPALGSQPKPAVIQQEIVTEQPQESIEERKARLEARRDALLKKKKEEEALKAAAEEQKQEDPNMRRTWQRKEESAAEKKARIARCMKVLKNVDAGKPSAFVGMGGGGDKPIQINWLDDGDVEGEDDLDDDTVVEVQKQGKKRTVDDTF